MVSLNPLALIRALTEHHILLVSLINDISII
jgi:hypothetical protein